MYTRIGFSLSLSLSFSFSLSTYIYRRLAQGVWITLVSFAVFVLDFCDFTRHIATNDTQMVRVFDNAWLDCSG